MMIHFLFFILGALMTSIPSSVKADVMESVSIPAGTTCLFGVTDGSARCYSVYVGKSQFYRKALFRVKISKDSDLAETQNMLQGPPLIVTHHHRCSDTFLLLCLFITKTSLG